MIALFSCNVLSSIFDLLISHVAVGYAPSSDAETDSTIRNNKIRQPLQNRF